MLDKVLPNVQQRDKKTSRRINCNREIHYVVLGRTFRYLKCSSSKEIALEVPLLLIRKPSDTSLP